MVEVRFLRPSIATIASKPSVQFQFPQSEANRRNTAGHVISQPLLTGIGFLVRGEQGKDRLRFCSDVLRPAEILGYRPRLPVELDLGFAHLTTRSLLTSFPRSLY